MWFNFYLHKNTNHHKGTGPKRSCRKLRLWVFKPIRKKAIKKELGGLSEKIDIFLGIFPKSPDPPHPPFGKSCLQKNECLFCILGHKKHFQFSQKKVNILTFTFGNRATPPPARAKFPKLSRNGVERLEIKWTLLDGIDQISPL